VLLETVGQFFVFQENEVLAINFNDLDFWIRSNDCKMMAFKI